MTKITEPTVDSTRHTKSSAQKSERLYYLDWLRNILIFGVFLYHVLRPFDPLMPWHINNAVKSDAIMGILLTINPWGIPLFFLVAGAGSMFALRRRSNRQFISERVNRLLIPFIVGSILLSPFQRYLEALHNGRFEGSFLSFIPEWLAGLIPDFWFTPGVFGDWGLHLWFLAFLFLFSLLALPVFSWFKRDTGGAFVSWLGRLVEKRGGILLFVLPLALARVLVLPFVPVEVHGWLDFVYFFLFFVVGYIFYADDRFVSAVRRDRWLLFASGIAGLVAYFALSAVYGEDVVIGWGFTFAFPGSIIANLFFTLISWGWALFVLYLAMTRLNFSNKFLVYGNETIMPFYLVHQPVIIVVSYFVVQWNVSILVKLLIIGISSLLIGLGLIELLIKPFEPMRRLFGMKPKRGDEVKAKTTAA
ncbi:MAG: acyltransferase [Chloroflexi bacterium]|nr:acyltransferase [Chloroflexota bacterium]